MKKIEKNGFVLTFSGTAKQVVLYCHGGWIEKDGITEIPQGLTVCFYAGHGHFTVGTSVYNEVIRRGQTARNGFAKTIAMSGEDLEAYAKAYGKDIETAKDEFMKNAVGTYDSFGGGNFMYDYSLSREPDGGRRDAELRLFSDHLRGTVSSDVDLLMLKTTSDRHLSDAFKFIKTRGYSTMHFGACRVPYGASPSEVSK